MNELSTAHYAHALARERGQKNQLRFSDLKRIALSPAHYMCALQRDRSLQTSTQKLGTAIHALVLGGRKVIEYPKRRSGKEWDAFVMQYSGEIILSSSEYDRALGCAGSVIRNRDAMALLQGKREEELPEWSILGRKCGGRPDVLGDGYVTELKTGQTSHPSWFVRQAIRMGYHAQLAWYRHGANESAIAIKDAYIVAVEQTPPFVVTPMQLTQRALEAGDKQWRIWFEQLIVCEDDNHYPGYTQSVVEFDVPELDDVEFTFGDEPAETGEAA